MAFQKKNTQKIQFVEVSCGQCKFGMKSGGCDLAVRIDGKSYFVDGAKIDQYGDSHRVSPAWVSFTIPKDNAMIPLL